MHLSIIYFSTFTNSFHSSLVESPTATDGCHKDTVIPVILHLSPIVDVVANKQANGSVCDPIMNEKGNISLYISLKRNNFPCQIIVLLLI